MNTNSNESSIIYKQQQHIYNNNNSNKNTKNIINKTYPSVATPNCFKAAQRKSAS